MLLEKGTLCVMQIEAVMKKKILKKIMKPSLAVSAANLCFRMIKPNVNVT